MKNLFSLLLACFVITGIQAQNCSTYFPFQEGVVRVYNNLDKKGKVASTVKHEVMAIEETDEGQTAKVATEMIVGKNEPMEGAFEVLCTEDVISVDVTSFVMPALSNAFVGMEVEMEGDGLELPSTLAVGQSLDGGQATIRAGSNGLTIMNVTTIIENRKVEAKEKVSTPAGSYDCYKITYDMTIKMVITKTMKVVEWVNEEVGLVKQENYKTNGKIESSLELKSFSK